MKNLNINKSILYLCCILATASPFLLALTFYIGSTFTGLFVSTLCYCLALMVINWMFMTMFKTLIARKAHLFPKDRSKRLTRLSMFTIIVSLAIPALVSVIFVGASAYEFKYTIAIISAVVIALLSIYVIYYHNKLFKDIIRDLNEKGVEL